MRFIELGVVARGGIEPPTRGFSGVSLGAFSESRGNQGWLAIPPYRRKVNLPKYALTRSVIAWTVCAMSPCAT
jgi:hypothetical protein